MDCIQDPPAFLDRDGEDCYFAREYVAQGGYRASEANNLISNLKKPPDRKGTPEWKYKTKAIQQFARELSQVLNQNAVIAAIPTSKAKTDPQYDSRLDDTLAELTRIRPDITIVEPFEMGASTESYHASGGRRTRNPDEIYQQLVWKGLPSGVSQIVLMDDVLTTGAHFKACKRLILENAREVRVYGVFWAKTIWPNQNINE